MNIELLIQHENTAYLPAVLDGIDWTTNRKDAPGQLDFTVLADSTLQLAEGDHVRLTVDGTPVFYGFLFTKKQDKKGEISITAYDQLRYFKNKDIYVYENKTAGEFIATLAADFNLQTGSLAETGYKIASRVENNTTLFDMVQSAIDMTTQNTKEMYVLFDDFGKLALKNISELITDILIDADTGENYSYSSSIDGDTYNKVKLIYENSDKGTREVYVVQDSTNMNKWGVLQLHDTIEDGENGQIKAETLMQLHNRPAKSLSINNAFGSLKVRAGSMVVVQMDLGDVQLSNLMLVEKCKHMFTTDTHYMDLVLRGGEFIA